MSISFDNIESVAREGKVTNEVMINHGTLFYDRLNMEFILTVSTLLRLPFFQQLVTTQSQKNETSNHLEKRNVPSFSGDILNDCFIRNVLKRFAVFELNGSLNRIIVNRATTNENYAFCHEIIDKGFLLMRRFKICEKLKNAFRN